MKSAYGRLLWLLILWGFAGCMLQPALTSLTPTPTLPTIVPTFTPWHTFTPAPITPTAPEEPCSWQWASRLLDDLTSSLTQDMRAQDIEALDVRVTAYGEECIGYPSGDVLQFTPMQTEYTIVLPAPANATEEELGKQVRAVLEVLSAYPVEATPGPQPGMVQVSLQAEANTWMVRFRQDAGEAALQRGLDGEALWLALQSP